MERIRPGWPCHDERRRTNDDAEPRANCLRNVAARKRIRPGLPFERSGGRIKSDDEARRGEGGGREGAGRGGRRRDRHGARQLVFYISSADLISLLVHSWTPQPGHDVAGCQILRVPGDPDQPGVFIFDTPPGRAFRLLVPPFFPAPPLFSPHLPYATRHLARGTFFPTRFQRNLFSGTSCTIGVLLFVSLRFTSNERFSRSCSDSLFSLSVYRPLFSPFYTGIVRCFMSNNFHKIPSAAGRSVSRS